MAVAQKVHVHHDDLVADPVVSAMARTVEAKPRGGYSGQRRYALARFGIDPDWLTAQFTQYRDYCGVIPQAAE